MRKDTHPALFSTPASSFPPIIEAKAAEGCARHRAFAIGRRIKPTGLHGPRRTRSNICRPLEDGTDLALLIPSLLFCLSACIEAMPILLRKTASQLGEAFCQGLNNWLWGLGINY